MNEAMLFGSTFGVVFFLGFQSLSVNSGHYWLAGVNSLIIGGFNLLLFKTAPHVAGVPETLCYMIGGPLGILSAMWVHRNLVRPWMDERKQASDIVAFRGIMKKQGWKELG